MTTRDHVIVLGDESVDWHVIKAQESMASCWHSPGGTVAAMPGGARLLRHLIGQCLSCVTNPVDVDNTGIASLFKADSSDANFSQTMAICGMFFQEAQSKNKVLRIETLCGFQKAQRTKPFLEDSLSGLRNKVVVIDDAGLGTRSQTDSLIEAISGFTGNQEQESPWIIHKVAWPILDNPLLSALAQQYGRKLIVIVPVDDLRRDSVQISRGLSWERTAQDIVWEINYNPRMKMFASVHSFVVPLGLSGVWLSMGCVSKDQPIGGTPLCTLVYDPSGIEGDWEKYRPGLLLGYTSCMTVGIISSLLRDTELRMVDAACSGLSAMRAFHSTGYRLNVQRGTMEMPILQIRQAIETPTEFASVRVPLGHRHFSVPAGPQVDFKQSSPWSILRSGAGTWSSLFDLAIGIVREGPVRNLGRIPYARFGGLLTVDRDEIEAFRTTYDLMQSYCTNATLHRPLSIAVFGPPGSGKSFGVAQVAKAVAGEGIDKKAYRLQNGIRMDKNRNNKASNLLN